MIPKKDPKIRKAYDNLMETISFIHCTRMDCDIATNAPEMTHIEQLAFFELLKYQVNDTWEVHPQAKIDGFRVDFLIHYIHIGKDGLDIVVECDGHNFHEKTKEQAIKDKSRDRKIQELGYPVIRFSGSEIWKTNGECISEYLLNYLKIRTPKDYPMYHLLEKI